jgi:hypothetical protein
VAAIILKPGVRIRGLQPEMLLALFVAEHEYSANGRALVLTSALDGVHSAKSLHYQGLAVDIRSKTLTESDQKRRVAGAIAAALGECYEVLLEDEGGHNEHIHIELSPIGLKRRGE